MLPESNLTLLILAVHGELSVARHRNGQLITRTRLKRKIPGQKARLCFERERVSRPRFIWEPYQVS